MTNQPFLPGIRGRNALFQAMQRCGRYLQYRRYLRRQIGGGSEGFERSRLEFTGYPQNHDFFIYEGSLIPSFKLFERFREIEKCYPEEFSSLLDVSACRGFYVLDASRRNHLSKAVGIDIVEDFIENCHKAKQAIGERKSQFQCASLEDFHAQCMKSKQQFDVTIFLGSYHYFYWGSAQCSLAYMCHDRILRMIADLTRHRVIFSGRLETERLADYPKYIAKSHPGRHRYTTDVFLQHAEKYFEIKELGGLGRSPLYIMDKKPRGL